MNRRKPVLPISAISLAVAATFLLAPAAHASTIVAMGTVFTNSCNDVCPELTTGVGDGYFTLVGQTTLRGALVATFQVPGAYQGGQLTWSIGMDGQAPSYTGSVLMTQWDMGPATINGITLEEYYENFSLGSSGINLSAGNYYFQLTDPSSPPDQFGIYWATDSQGVAFSLEGFGNEGSESQQPVPEPSTLTAAAMGLAAVGCGVRNRRARSSA